jgi:hypothetical protein
VRRSMVVRSRPTNQGVRPYVRENRQMRPSNAVRTVCDAEAIDTSHLGFRPIQKIALHASSGFIRGIPTKSETTKKLGYAFAHKGRSAQKLPLLCEVFHTEI